MLGLKFHFGLMFKCLSKQSSYKITFDLNLLTNKLREADLSNCYLSNDINKCHDLFSNTPTEASDICRLIQRRHAVTNLKQFVRG